MAGSDTNVIGATKEMRMRVRLITSVVVSLCALLVSGEDFKGGFPTPEAAQNARDAADYQRAVTAYRFWYPTVSCEGMINGNRQAGANENQAMMIMACGPKQVFFTPNSDTPYGAIGLDLRNGPMVIEVPPGQFIGLVDDHNQGWVLDMGLPGPAGNKGGKHLILPPGYTGVVPHGYFAGRSPTNKALGAIRSLPQNGDVKAALEALKTVKVYPLADAANPSPITFIDVSDRAIDGTCLKWEDNAQYWEKLAAVIDAEPIQEKFLPMYGQLAALGIERGKPFKPDDRMKGILTKAAKDGRDQMLVSAFASGRPDRFAWPDRKWEWAGLVPESAQFETASGIDLEARDRWFIQAIVTSPAMFRRSNGAGSLYWLGCRDSAGEFVDGGKTYKLTVPQPAPAGLFWSVTLYDAQTRSEVQTDQGKAALRSLFELKDAGGAQLAGAKSAVDLYFGPTAPAGKENQWIKTIPGKGWFAYFRIYGPQGPAFDGSWKPGDFEEVK
jgi:hypothetical protein